MTPRRGPDSWAGSTRAARLPPTWRAIRARILTRDGHRCRACAGPANHVDHIVPGDNHDDANLQALCPSCHNAKSAREGATAAALVRARSPRQNRPPEPHPGLLSPRGAR
jgi:5-methylcytosine-specific restriction endonuclease McrA